MVTRIYLVLDGTSAADAQIDIDDYATHLEDALRQRYADAEIEIETTMHETGELPIVVETDTYEERDEVMQDITLIYEAYCRAQ